MTSETPELQSTASAPDASTARFVKLYEGQEKQFKSDGPSWLYPFRRSAISRFSDVGLPTKYDEEWKYSDARHLGKFVYELPAESTDVTSEEIEAVIPDGIDRYAVLVDGFFSTALSKIGGLTGATIKSLRTELDQPDSTESETSLQTRFGERSPAGDSGFAALNGALFRDGLLVRVGDNVSVPTVAVVHFTTGRTASEDGAALVFTRSLFEIGAGSSASIVEIHTGRTAPTGTPDRLHHHVSDVVTARSSKFDHYKLELEVPEATHYGLTRASLGAGSRYGNHFFSFGSNWVRNEIRSYLGGEGSHCDLNGLFVGRDSRHVDCHTTLDHAVPNCTSWEVYRGILDDQSTASFLGKINVYVDAQKTDAKQSSANLLLSEKATINTRPCLEIYADDVKCTHGATIGQIDENSRFYLQSRGIPADMAQRMLVHAFASELIDALECEPVQARLATLLNDSLTMKRDPSS